MSSLRTPGKFGRLAPHPMETHPRVLLENYLDFNSLPAVPPVVDVASKVSDWPMYMNDTIGDCTIAGAGHMIQAMTAYASTEVTLPDQVILDVYEKVGGYVPGQPSTDQGCNMQDVLTYWQKESIGGHKISAFAEIKHYFNPWKLKQALYLFGSVYLGINCPASAQAQFSNGEPWSYDPSSPIEGGHAIALQQQVPVGSRDGVMGVITWGALQPMEIGFAENYIEEAWVVITPDWIAANGDSVDGFSLSQLMADFSAINNW